MHEKPPKKNLLSLWRGSSFTSSSLRMCGLLTPFLWLSHPLKESHFSHLYLQPHSFSHYPNLITTGTRIDLYIKNFSAPSSWHWTGAAPSLLLKKPLSLSVCLFNLLSWISNLDTWIPPLEAKTHLQPTPPEMGGALLPFPTENHGRRHGGANYHPGHFRVANCTSVS